MYFFLCVWINKTNKQKKIKGYAGTHVWGWEGSSPKETLSPWISLKHFSQKWYLSARSPYFGELHRWPTAQPITEKARRSSHQSGQDRTGQGGGHTGGGRGQGRSSPGGSSQSWCRVFVWAGILILRVNFRVDDWSHQSRPMQTSQALNKEGERGRREGEKGNGGRGQNEY